jgi:hypothetical protein
MNMQSKTALRATKIQFINSSIIYCQSELAQGDLATAVRAFSRD